MTQVAFLILLLLGVVALIGGMLWTRLNWRADIPPYRRRMRVLDVTLHPERYARADTVRTIRALNRTGAIFLTTALAILAYELLRISFGR